MPKLGLQLYTLRELMSEDFIGTLEKVSSIGYQGVEFAGYGGLSASELRKVLSDLGLEAVSSHVQLPDLETNLDNVLEYAQELGLNYVVCPFLHEDRRRNADDYRRLADSFNQIGETCSEAGIKFCYHNHAFEFTKLDTQFALDALYNWTNPSFVQAELDMYWIEYANQSAVEYLNKYTDRVDLLHVKDMTDDEERFFTEVGSGQLDIPKILAAAESANVQWYLVEQDKCRRDSLESVTMSYQYLSRIITMMHSSENRT